MKRKAEMKGRAAVLLLAALLLAASLSGCFEKKSTGSGASPAAQPSPMPSGITEQEPAAEIEPIGGDIELTDSKSRERVYESAYGTFKPDEPMLRAGGRDVDWQEFYYWLLVSTEFYIDNYGEIEDWDASDGKRTVREYILGEAVDIIRLHAAVENKAAELGVTVSASDREYLEKTKQQIIDGYGGREAFEAELARSFMTEELYDRSNLIAVLYYNTFTRLYGENGERASDEDCAEFAKSIELLRVKHILFPKLDGEGNPLTDAEVSSALAQAEELLSGLLALPAEEREREFDEKMRGLSKDPDLEYYPDGYVFIHGSGELIEELDDAAARIEPGELFPQVIESEAGFHLLMRLAPDPDMLADDYYTLRYYAAYKRFEDEAAQWRDETPVEYTEAFGSVDPEKMFPGL